jgi:hypothetical protein
MKHYLICNSRSRIFAATVLGRFIALALQVMQMVEHSHHRPVPILSAKIVCLTTTYSLKAAGFASLEMVHYHAEILQILQ